MFSGDIVGIAVEHPVGEGPEIVGGEIGSRFLIAPRRRITGLGAADGTPLAHVMRIGLDRVGVEIEFAIQAGMHGRQVVALKIVVDIGFPVALHLIGAALKELHGAKWKTLGLWSEVADALVERTGIGIEIHEDQVEPFFAAHRHERKVFRAEAFDSFDLGGMVEGAIEVVGPSVVDAAKKFARSAALRRRSSAMTADVVESAELLIGSTNYE